MTMLEATAEANNRDAYDRSKSHYVKRMDTVAGIGCVFMKESSLVVSYNIHIYMLCISL